MANIELVKTENLRSREGVPKWEEIDGWEDSTHSVVIYWRVVAGEDRFSIKLNPKTPSDPASAELSFEEVQAVRHEQHAYPFIAPKVGHEATVQALGIAEAA